MDALSTHRRPRRAFTLVEILIVIVIIGLLAGLLTPAVISSLNKAKRAVIRSDLSQLEMAITSYKQDTQSDYPPDFAGLAAQVLYCPPHNAADATQVVVDTQNEILQHVRRAFPRYTPGNKPYLTYPANATAWQKLVVDVGTIPGPNNTAFDLTSMNPAAAIVFWLGGIPDPESRQLMGFSANPRDPFDRGEDLNRNGVLDSGEDTNGNGVLDWGPRTKKRFDFDPTRLNNFVEKDPSTGNAVLRWTAWPTYGPEKTDVPYVYFRAHACGVDRRMEYAVEIPAGSTSVHRPLAHALAADNVAVPYLASANGDLTADPIPPISRTWHNADKFQLIAAGLDGRFGNRAPAEAYGPPATFGGFRITSEPASLSSDDGDRDNLTNFGGDTVENAMP